MPRYCYLLELFLFFSFIEIYLKFRTACQDYQAGKSVVKCLSQGHNRRVQVSFESTPYQSQSQCFNHSTMLQISAGEMCFRSAISNGAEC